MGNKNVFTKITFVALVQMKKLPAVVQLKKSREELEHWNYL